MPELAKFSCKSSQYAEIALINKLPEATLKHQAFYPARALQVLPHVLAPEYD